MYDDGSLAVFRVATSLQSLGDRTAFATAATGCASTQIVPNVLKDRLDSVLLMEEDAGALSLDAIKEHETSFFALRK